MQLTTQLKIKELGESNQCLGMKMTNKNKIQLH